MFDGIVEYKEIWGWYDPDADGMIPAKSLPSLVRDLPPPLGVKGTKQDSQTKAFRFCLSLGLTQKNGEVAFKQTLDALIQRNYGEKKIKLDGGSSPGGESPQAVKEILLKRQQTVSAVDVSAQLANPGKVVALTPRRAEMSKILAEELLLGAQDAGRREKQCYDDIQPGERRDHGEREHAVDDDVEHGGDDRQAHKAVQPPLATLATVCPLL